MSTKTGSNLSLELWRELTNTFEYIDKSHAKRIAHLNLTNPQFSVLSSLYENGAMPLNHISKQLNVTGANITCVMDNLQKRNYAERIPSTNDRRIINAQLTKEGKNVVKKLTPIYLKSMEEETKNLTEDEKKTLVELLSKLHN
ncbi:MAG: hypothetical protein COW71_00415 [Ignavibacteriales bacterium CG18_big_fil_WC_8_21_14_2_50_31_20]|nr:MAG: hypothetical protein COW71_00415 [Ignavibacteriales bacterium CG18_big_fil_WC_8_21_14_2_50_31_20]